MSNTCRICLNITNGNDRDYHPGCLKSLFGTTNVPTLNIKIGKLHTVALAMIGHTSLSGIQKKISLGLSTDRMTLQVAVTGGNFILKPQTGTYPALPENEHVTTRLAKLVNIEVAPNGLIALTDGSLAYIVRRFDRLPEGGKIRQEDFCQLAEKSPKEKYDGSAELCVKLLRKYAKEPMVDMLKLYRLLVFSWWTGNGDMHLKNFSLITGTDGITHFSPAYDQLNTRLVIPDDPLSLSVCGRKDKLNRKTWLEFAEYCGLPEKAAIRVLDRQSGVLNTALNLIDRSFLPQDQKGNYKLLITNRTADIA